MYLLQRMVTVDTKVRLFQYKLLINIRFVNKMLLKFRKVKSPLCSLCKTDVESFIHLFCRCRKGFILRRQHQEFLSSGLDLPSILPQSAIFGFLDDALEHKLLLNRILLILKN